jgi:hypothetical protein
MFNAESDNIGSTHERDVPVLFQRNFQQFHNNRKGETKMTVQPVPEGYHRVFAG